MREWSICNFCFIISIINVIILEDSVGDQGLCAKYFNKWNKNRQCKLGMTWRSLPQGNYFCFAHPLVRLRSMSFPVLKESCISTMIFFFKKAGGKKRKGMKRNKGYQPSVCLCSFSTTEDHTCSFSRSMLAVGGRTQCSAGLWAVLRVTLNCRSLVSPK